MQYNGPLPPLSTPYGAQYPPPPLSHDQQYPIYHPSSSYNPDGQPQQYLPGPSTPSSSNPSYHQHNRHPQPSDHPQHAPALDSYLPQHGSSPYTSHQPYSHPQYVTPPPAAATVEAVPPPTPKVDYAPPVFQTFQERKRAKELAIRAQNGTSSSPTPFVPPSVHINTAPTPPPRMYSGSSVSPLSPPPASTVAMMGQPSPLGGPPPPPPARSRSPSTRSISPVPGGPSSPAYPPPSSSRPLPPPRGQSPAVMIPPLPPPRGITPVPTPISTVFTPRSSGPPSPFTPARKSSLVQTPVTTPTLSSPAATAIAIQANLERSDTISSIKSLDRGMGFNSSPGRRPLPKPPVGVNSSKSLDRGIPSGIGIGVGTSAAVGMGIGMGEGFRKGMSRNQPSVVDEMGEETLVNGVSAIDLGGGRSRPVTPSTPSRPSSTSPQPPAPSAPSIILPGGTPQSDPKSPATFNPRPAINVPDSDSSSVASTDEEAANGATPRAKKRNGGPSSPGIQFSGLPVISVSSSDTADEDSTGEISFTVPSINVGESDAPPTINLPTTPAYPSAGPSRPTRAEQTGSGIICSGCDYPIIGRIVNAMNQRWHPQCFMCAQCGELLEHVSSYEWQGKAYCHLDYHDKFAHRCHHCKTPIVEPRFVTLNDPVLGQRYYHELHFFCSECGDPFLDPSQSSAPGTESQKPHAPSQASHLHNGNVGVEEEEDEGETNAFVIHKGHPYCEKCHLRLHKPKCKACNLPIPDMAINAMGANWHKECFVCCQCRDEFANNLFFPKEGKAFCTLCYEDLIASDR
ncbi:hypothetical protein IAR55_002120 [Kwoniella newhampshirensis]|uniref:LIM zinc-binding domain-containing protein n=1 Tax=Kwoniella newhampshirensis TaxID=1651941 RepID=A0AAW0YYM4_9TREE